MSNQLTDDQIIEAMRKAGIPQRCCDKKHSLTKYGKIGETLLEWMDGGVRDFFFVTSDPIAMYAFYTLARNTVLRGISTRIVGLPDLVESITDPDYREELDHIGALFVVGFYKDGFTGKPFNPETGDRIEWFLSRRLQGLNKTLFQANREPSGCGWWSPQFLRLIERSLDDGPMIVESIA